MLVPPLTWLYDIGGAYDAAGAGTAVQSTGVACQQRVRN